MLGLCFCAHVTEPSCTAFSLLRYSWTYLRNQLLDKNDALLPTLLRMARFAVSPILPRERRLKRVVTYRRRYVAVLVYVPAYAYISVRAPRKLYGEFFFFSNVGEIRSNSNRFSQAFYFTRRLLLE